MTTLAFFLEERSAREMLDGLLPRILPEGIDISYIVFEGKSDLERQLPRKLKGWRRPDTKFIVLRDQDSADCRQVKQKLADICKQAGKPEALIRVACHELESWYFGDLAAVEKGLGLDNLARKQARARYRNPDEIANPSAALKRLTRGLYQKVSGSRAIGVHLRPGGNTSRSFHVFLDGVRRLAQADGG